MRLFFAILIVFTLLSDSSNAQNPSYIDTCFVSPNPSNNTDDLLLYASLYFPSSGCKKDSNVIKIVDDKIFLKSYYSVGIAASPCETKDTIFVGKLKPGNYKLVFTVIDTNRRQSDSDTLSFLVANTTSINLKSPQNHIGLYPNPTLQQLFFYNNGTIGGSIELKLYTLVGQLVFTKEIADHHAEIDIATLPKGMYIAVLTNQATGNRVVQKITLIN